MSAATKADPATPAGSAGSANPLTRRRPLGDRGFQILALAAGLVTIAFRIPDPARATGASIGLLLLVSPVLHPWYLLWALPFAALVPGVIRDIAFSIDSWTQPNFFDGYDYNTLIFIALLVIVVAAFAVIRSSAAPLHEEV